MAYFKKGSSQLSFLSCKSEIELLYRWVIDSGLGGLGDLVRMVLDVVDTPALAEVGARLHKVEGDVVADALEHEVHDPFVVADSGVGAGLATAGDLLDGTGVLLEDSGHGDVLEHGFDDDGFVADREFQENGQSAADLKLVLACAADVDVVPAISPVFGKKDSEALWTLGEKVKCEI